MAVRKTFSESDLSLFQQDLLQTLKNDPQHEFSFDGHLRVYSSRYGCEIKALNVKWVPDKGDMVLVGAIMRGKPVVDMSKGFPVFKTEIEIPFSECYNDLKANPELDELVLISKTRKAVIEKCIGYPMKLLRAAGIGSGSEGVSFDDFLSAGGFGLDDLPEVTSGLAGGAVYGRTEVHGVSQRDGDFIIEGEMNGLAGQLNLSTMSFCDIQRVGLGLHDINGLISRARKVYRTAKQEIVHPGQTCDRMTERRGDQAAIAAVYDAGYPLPVLGSVVKTFSVDYADLYDEVVKNRSYKEFEKMMRDLVDKGIPFDTRKISKTRKHGIE